MFTFNLPAKRPQYSWHNTLCRLPLTSLNMRTWGGTKVYTCLWADKLMTFREIADSVVQWHCWKATPRNVAPKSGNPLKH